MSGINEASKKKKMEGQPDEPAKKPRKPSKEKQAKLDYALCVAAIEGDDCALEELLLAGANPDAGNRHALNLSAKMGKTSSVKRLLAASKVEAGSPEALTWAAMEGRADCLALLCAKKYESKHLEIGLQGAALGGHRACVLELIERVESHEAKLVAVGVAAGSGRAEIVAIFLGIGVGSDESSLVELMERAEAGGHNATIEVIRSFVDGIELSKTVAHAAATSDKNTPRL